MKNKKQTKGFIITIDSIFALILMFSYVAVISNTLLTPLIDTSVQLQKQGMSVLTIVEHTRSYNLTQQYSLSNIFLQSSDSICMRLETFNGTSSTISDTFVKSGCPSSAAEETIVWRSIAHGGDFKTLKLALWFKV